MRGDRLRRRLSPAELGSERGQALVLAMAIIAVGMVLGLGAVAYAMSVGGQGNHDLQRRAAQQAADAGVQQQLYQQSDSDAVGYGVSSGSVGSLLDCVESKLGVGINANLSTSFTQIALGVGGVCPQQTCTKGTANCSSGTGPIWSSLDNGDYYDAEFCPDPEYQASNTTPTAACGTPTAASNSSTLGVEFPEIVSVGCHSAGATCDTGSSANQYSKEVALLNPTAPFQAIEAENNVRINPTGAQTCTGIAILSVCLGVSNVAATIVDGNIVAGNALQLPATTIGLSTSTAANLVTDLLNDLTGLLGLNNITSPLEQDLGLNTGQQPASLTPTYEYGNCVGTGVSPLSGVSSPSGSYSCTGGSGLSLNGSQVNTGLNNVCSAGNLSTKCTLTRPSFSVGAGTTVTPQATLATMMSGGTLGSCASATSAALANGSAGNCYVNGDLSLTSGSLALSAGTYVFCNVFIGSGASLTGPSGSTKGAVQIYILAPGSTQCGSNTSGANNVEGATCTSGSDTEGNFTAPSGINDSLGGLIDGITSTVDPSNFQIYVAGDAGDNLTVNSNCQPRTAVNIGSSGLNLSQAFVLYAPRSNVTVTSNLIFEGAAIGWNVNLTALAILQDLDLGNYPLSSIATSYSTDQTVSCTASSASNVEFAGTTADLTGC